MRWRCSGITCFKVTPIALQTVINRISDSFVVVDPAYNVIDYNKTLLSTASRGLQTCEKARILLKC